MADIWVQCPHCGALNDYRVIVPPDGVDGADEAGDVRRECLVCWNQWTDDV
jgi:hypothetical protein